MAIVTVPLPAQIVNGTITDASQIMADLNAIANNVNLNAAPLASPALTGIPTAPTAALATNTTQVATTAFVAASVVAGQTGVASFNTRSGAVTLATSDITGAGGAPLASPAFTGIPTAPTAATTDNSTTLATTAYVKTAVSGATATNVSGVVAAVNGGTGVAGTLAGVLFGNNTAPHTVATAAQIVSAIGTTAVTNATAATNSTQLNGQAASYYQTAIGYTPANQAGDTFTGTVYTPLLYASGAGATLVVNSTSNVYAKQLFQDSGVTRGLIGANSSYCFAAINAANNLAGFTVDNSGNCSAAGQITATQLNGAISGAQVATGLGYTPVQQATGIGQSSNVIKIGWSAAGQLKVTVDATDIGYFAMLSGAAFTGAISAPTVTQTSDERKKTDWKCMPKTFIEQLAGLKKSGLFRWKKKHGGGASLGISAQELEAFLPEAVHTDEQGFKSVNYGAAAMVACVELAREVRALRAELIMLKGAK